jgi:hypothetical protein
MREKIITMQEKLLPAYKNTRTVWMGFFKGIVSLDWGRLQMDRSEVCMIPLDVYF